jgi:hypothetical protein
LKVFLDHFWEREYKQKKGREKHRDSKMHKHTNRQTGAFRYFLVLSLKGVLIKERKRNTQVDNHIDKQRDVGRYFLGIYLKERKNKT